MNDIFQLFASIDHIIPLFFIKLFLCLKLFQIPVVKMEIIAVKRWHTVFSHLLKKVFRPRSTFFRLISIRAAGDAFHGKCLIAASKRRTGGTEFPVFVRIHLRRHFSTAVPYFISDTPVFNLERFFMAVCFSFLRKCRRLFAVTVLHPLSHLGWRAGHHIDIKPWLRADHLAEFHHLVRTELIGIRLESTEVFIVCNRPLLPRTYAVPPVIYIRKTSARPADHRRVQLLKCIHKVFSDSMIIRNLRILSNPDSIINTGAKKLYKVSLQFRVNIFFSS